MDMKQIENIRTIGSRVDELRKNHNEKRCDLAKAIGVSPGHMSDLLNDHYTWTDEKVMAVAEHYGVDYGLLYYGIGEPVASSVIDDDIIRMRTHLQSLPRKKRREECKRVMLELLEVSWK